MLVVVMIAIALATAVGAAAFWTAAGSGPGAAEAGHLNPPTGVTAGPTSGSTVPVSWTASATGVGAAAPQGYYVESSSDGGSTWSPACASGPSSPLSVTPASCEDTGVSDGHYVYRVTAVYADHWSKTSDPSSPPVTVSAGAEKLVLTTAAQTLTAGVASGTVTVQRQTDSGTPTTTGTTTVDLSTDSAGMFRNTANTLTISSVTIGPGTSSADFKYTDTVAGSPAVTAADEATILAPAIQTETVNPAVAYKLVDTQLPGDSSTNDLLTPQPNVTVEDQYGNAITTDSSTVTLSVTSLTPTSGGPGSLTGCSQSETNGVVSFSDCQITTTGTGYKLHATDGLLVPADTSPFNITSGVAAPLSVPGDPPSTVAGDGYSPTLSVLAPATATVGAAISAASITATLAASSGGNATGTITFQYFQQASAPGMCTSGGTTIGAASVSGNGVYNPNVGFTPSVAGNYWLSASYGGDGNNNTAASACPPGAAQEIVVAPASPALSVLAPAATG